jgi:hypothetical protein
MEQTGVSQSAGVNHVHSSIFRPKEGSNTRGQSARKWNKQGSASQQGSTTYIAQPFITLHRGQSRNVIDPYCVRHLYRLYSRLSLNVYTQRVNRQENETKTVSHCPLGSVTGGQPRTFLNHYIARGSFTLYH